MISDHPYYPVIRHSRWGDETTRVARCFTCSRPLAEHERNHADVAEKYRRGSGIRQEARDTRAAIRLT